MRPDGPDGPDSAIEYHGVGAIWQHLAHLARLDQGVGWNGWNGRPYVEQLENNGKGNNASEYADLSAEQKAEVQRWIAKFIAPRKQIDRRHTSYGLKHGFDRTWALDHPTGFYMSNGAFKGAMLAAGYEPSDRNALNWNFRIYVKKGAH